MAGSANHRRPRGVVANPVRAVDHPHPGSTGGGRGRATDGRCRPRGRWRRGLPGDRCSTCPRRGTGDGLWRFEDGKAVEILKGSDEALFEPPAVSADGRRVAVILRRDGKRRLHVLSADGGDLLQSLGETIDIQRIGLLVARRQVIVAGGIDDRGPGLFKIPLDRGGDLSD